MPVGMELQKQELRAAKTDDKRRCRLCGCTDDDCSGCIERTGQPCYWVAPDLCSACADRLEGRPTVPAQKQASEKAIQFMKAIGK